MRALLAVVCSSCVLACGTQSTSGGGGAGAGSVTDAGAADAGSALPLTDVLAAYGKAWEETDPAARLALLGTCFADDGRYVDPLENAAGRGAFSDLIGNFQGQFPGATITFTTGVDSFEDQFRYEWQIALADGKPFMTGEDQGQVGKDGRIARMTGFFDGSAQVAAPPAVDALLRALNGKTAAARLSELQSSVVEPVSWTDRWMHTDGRDTVVDHFGTWLTPSPGTTFALVGKVSLHDDLVRADLTLTSGGKTDEGQVFGHLDPGGLMDWVTFADGALPPR